MILDIINGLFSLCLIIEYISSTYNAEIWDNEVWGSLNLFIHIYFLLLYLVRLFAAKDKNKHITSSESIVDILSIFPFLFLKITSTNMLEEDAHSILTTLVNLFSLFRLLCFERFINYVESVINK